MKRYRPGAPPASPHIGARALPAATAPTITPIAPWYRRLAPWTAIVVVVARDRRRSWSCWPRRTRPTPPGAPAVARPPPRPQGTKVIDGNGFGIAAPSSWIVGVGSGQHVRPAAPGPVERPAGRDQRRRQRGARRRAAAQGRARPARRSRRVLVRPGRRRRVRAHALGRHRRSASTGSRPTGSRSTTGPAPSSRRRSRRGQRRLPRGVPGARPRRRRTTQFSRLIQTFDAR